MKWAWAFLLGASAMLAEAQTANMQEISQALGVRCDYCHSAPRGSDQPEPKKEVARAMMVMTRDLNAKVQEATGKPANETTRVESSPVIAVSRFPSLFPQSSCEL